MTKIFVYLCRKYESSLFAFQLFYRATLISVTAFSADGSYSRISFDFISRSYELRAIEKHTYKHRAKITPPQVGLHFLFISFRFLLFMWFVKDNISKNDFKNCLISLKSIFTRSQSPNIIFFMIVCGESIFCHSLDIIQSPKFTLRLW